MQNGISVYFSEQDLVLMDIMYNQPPQSKRLRTALLCLEHLPDKMLQRMVRFKVFWKMIKNFIVAHPLPSLMDMVKAWQIEKDFSRFYAPIANG